MRLVDEIEYALLQAGEGGFGDLLRRCRLAAGLTQRDLASRLKKPHSYVYKVETGERRIGIRPISL